MALCTYFHYNVFTLTCTKLAPLKLLFVVKCGKFIVKTTNYAFGVFFVVFLLNFKTSSKSCGNTKCKVKVVTHKNGLVTAQIKISVTDKRHFNIFSVLLAL